LAASAGGTGRTGIGGMLLVVLWTLGMTAVGTLLWGAGTDPVAIAATLSVMAALGLAARLFRRGANGRAPAPGATAVRDALDHLGEAVAVEAVSESGGADRVLYLNAVFARLFGIEEAPTGTVEAMLSAVLVAPDGGPDAVEAAQLLQALCAEPLGTEVRHAEIDGPGPRHSARRFHIWTVPVGAQTRVWVIRDMTQISRAEERARDRLAVLSRALEQAPFGLILLGEDQTVREANATFRQMVGRETLSGHDFADLFREQDRTSIDTMLGAPEAGGRVTPVDAAPLSDPETTLTLHASRTAESRGGRGGALLYVLDATERKRLEMQFAQSQKMQALGQLAGGVAHDFNNMLTAIIGFCDLVLQRHHQGEQTFADVMQITQNAKRAARLVRQLLAFSRQQPLEPKLTNVTDVLADISSLLKRVLGERVTFDLKHGRDLGLVKADHSQLEQVIINLAVNARDAIDGDGTLSIETDMVELEEPVSIGGATAPAGRYLKIDVADSGTGIPEEIIDRIFDPFFTTKDIGAGTGLGLSMVYGSLQQMDGFVGVDSRTTGETGTTFSLYIPEAAPHGTEIHDDAAAAGPEGDSTGGGEILLVEDEDPVRLFSARALRSKGYIVTEARTGAAALEILAENRFDLLVTDMMMPEVDGATLIKTARGDMPDLPVVCISGYTQESVAEEITALPRVYFLPKPFSLKQLAAKVKTALQHEP